MYLTPLFFDDPSIQREFRKGVVHSYRMHVETDESTPALKLDYTFWTRCKAPDANATLQPIEIQVRNLHEYTDKLSVRRAKAGLGSLTLATTGLPPSIRDFVSSEPFWAPLLVLYLPSAIKDGDFDASEALGAGAKLTGKGTYKEGQFDFDGHIESQNGSTSDVKLSWSVDDHGWLVDGEGTIVDPSGTVSFKVVHG